MLANLREELFGGWSKKEAIYAWTLIALQVLFYVIYPDSFWGFIAGTSGTICVLLVAKRKISNYFFGFIQTGIIMVLGFQAFLIGETGENIFYFITQFWGIKQWKENMVKDEDKETKVVETRKFTAKDWIVWSTVTLVGAFGLGYVFNSFGGTQPFLDSYTLVAALIGQVLMLYRFREQWLFWITLNAVSLYQWVTLGNMSLAAMYIAFLINSLYGYWNWSQESKSEKEITTVTQGGE